MRRLRLRMLALAGSALLAASCASTGSPSPATSTPPPAPATVMAAPNLAGQGLSGWIAHFTNGVRFIQWVENGAALTGTSSWVLTSTNDPTKLEQGSGSFTGTVSGDSVILMFSGGVGGAGAWAGTLNSDTLTLSFATSDGSMEVDTYRPGTVDDYNAAVAQVKAGVQQSEDAAASAVAASAAAQQQTEAAFSQHCTSLGGTANKNPIFGMVCAVNFPDAQDQPVPLNADGSLDAAKAEINHGNCLSRIQDAQAGAQDGHNWQYPPVWHAEMGACDPGHP